MVGKSLGHYEILEPLGKGGMGEDIRLGRKVAIRGNQVRALSEMIRRACPRLVVFYSADRSYRKYWCQVAGLDFSSGAVEETSVAGSDQTVFAIILHTSMMRGASKDYQQEVGLMLATMINELGTRT